MPKRALRLPVDRLKESLEIIEHELARGDASEEVLDDFRVAVDNVRTGILAILSATRSDDYDSSLAKFRLKRASQLAQNVLSDFVLGTVPPDASHLEDFRATAAALQERVDLMCGCGLMRLSGSHPRAGGTKEKPAGR